MNFTMEGLTDLQTSSRKKSYSVCVCVRVCYNRLSQCQSASPTLIIMPLMVHADSIHFLHLFGQITDARNSPVRMQKCPCTTTTRQLACCYCTQYTLSQTMSSLFCLACASVAPPKAVKVLPLPPHPLACNAQVCQVQPMHACTKKGNTILMKFHGGVLVLRVNNQGS